MENDMQALAQRMIDAVRGVMAKADAAVESRLAAMEQRIAGIHLVKGDPGSKGDPGAPGPRGERGETGSPGEAGPVGPRGEAGLEGKHGETGAQGLPGPRGEAGAQGEPGLAGADGKEGLQGSAGPRGEAGAQGQPGQKGEPGEMGPVGSIGLQGEPGPRGESGAKGETGSPGAAGSQGERGLPGERGARGEAGDHGRDAAELEILPSIDEEKSYRRGTWASHNGGLIRASRQTDPVKGSLIDAGWVVMVEGVAAIVVTQEENQRELTVATMLTSGIKAAASFTLPVMIYREVWREGEYEKGDVCTWGGSAWHCQEKTKDKPGTSAAWRLMVKEGAKGRDGEVTSSTRKPVQIK